MHDLRRGRSGGVTVIPPKGGLWKNDAACFLWIRWYVAGKLLQTGSGLLVGAALAGVRLAAWYGLGFWILSIAVRLHARGLAKSGTRDVCCTCLTDCRVCLARHAAGQAAKQPLPGGPP